MPSTYMNAGLRTITVYGRRVKAGNVVDVGWSKKAAEEVAKFPCLKAFETDWQNKWQGDELRLLFRMIGWWALHPWVSQYRIIKTLQRSAEMSHRTFASIRTRVYRMARKRGVTYTMKERKASWAEGLDVDDGRLVRGKRLVKEAK